MAHVELSERNPYYISKHRYYELKHFCLQYPEWEEAMALLNGWKSRPEELQTVTMRFCAFRAAPAAAKATTSSIGSSSGY